MGAKIVNAVNFIRLNNKARVTSKRTFSFINKDALQLDCQKFNDILCGMEIDGKIYIFVSPNKNSDLTVNNTYSQHICPL